MSTDIIAPIDPADEVPDIRQVAIGDLKHALVKGFDDFRAMLTHVVFLCLVYPVVGLLIGRLAFGYNVLPLLYPMADGFALLSGWRQRHRSLNRSRRRFKSGHRNVCAPQYI
jgi:uncharacterized membrane protein